MTRPQPDIHLTRHRSLALAPIRLACLLWPLLMAPGASAQAPPAYNCDGTPSHRQFDFWLGYWQVTDKPGTTVYGENRISKRDKGCVLLEEYASVQSFTGTSINYYNPADKLWHQHWVDNGTSIIHTAGGLKGESMVMEGTIYYLAQQRSAPFRARWTPLQDGRVQQFFEEQDGTGQWNTWFDGYYQRLDPPVSTDTSR